MIRSSAVWDVCETYLPVEPQLLRNTHMRAMQIPLSAITPVCVAIHDGATK